MAYWPSADILFTTEVRFISCKQYLARQPFTVGGETGLALAYKIVGFGASP